jgi:hypothetical protein
VLAIGQPELGDGKRNTGMFSELERPREIGKLLLRNGILDVNRAEHTRTSVMSDTRACFSD